MKAEEVRARNRFYDEELRAEAEGFDSERLHEAPDGEWSAAQVLAHLGEFPRFFAGELQRWRDDPTAVVGRTHEHPVRLAAVSAPAEELDELMTAMRSAFAELAGGVLRTLPDEALDAKTENVKYGPEPLSAFLDRYVLDHKAGHLEQLRALAGAAGGAAAASGPTPG